MKLTNQHRQDIIKACLKKTFAQREAEYEAMRTALADALYAHMHGEHEKLANKMPQGWLEQVMNLEISAPGFRRYLSDGEKKCSTVLKMSKARRVPYSGGKYAKVEAGHPLYDQSQEVVAGFESLEAAKTELEMKLVGVLSAVSTVEKLRQAWPEGEPFFPVEKPKQTAVVPYELAMEVNKIMGIKPAKGGKK